MDSILTSIKDLLGITEEYDHFDKAIIAHINTVFMTLNQLGVGPVEGFSIKDSSTTWSDYLEDMTKFEAVKSYIHLNVKLLFDPPASATITDVISRQIEQLEWRLNVNAESVDIGVDDKPETEDPETEDPETEDPSYEVRIEDDTLILS